jgi:hypothetical protein
VTAPTGEAAGSQPVNPDRRATSLGRIPLPYSIALRLRDAGIADDLIAQCVGVDVTALTTLMTIAEAKLAAAEHDDANDR